MFKSGRKNIGIGLAAGLVIASVVGVTSMTSADVGDPQGTPPPLVEYGTLTIDLTDRAGTLTFQPVESTVLPFIQPLRTEQPCSTVISDPIEQDSIVVSIDKDLLSFGATGGTNPNPQLPSSGIGVTDGANCGEPAGLIGPGETLTLTLGDFFDEDVQIGSGSLEIGKNRQPDGNLELRYGLDENFTAVDPVVAVGVSPVPVGINFTTVELRSTAKQSSRGLSLRGGTEFILVAPAPATVPHAPTNVTAVPGNAQAVVSWTAPFDGGSEITDYKVEYKASNGEWTNVPSTPASPDTSRTVTNLTNGTSYTFRVSAINAKGTSEPSVPSDPVTPILQIIGEVDCQEQLALPGSDGVVAANGLFYRLDNGTGKPPVMCKKVDVTIQITDDYVFWVNKESEDQDVRALFTIEWAGVPSANYTTRRTINYEGEAQQFPLQWCTSFEISTENDDVIVDAVLPVGQVGVDDNSNPIFDTVPWCLVDTTEELRGDGKVYQTDIMFGAGDPRRS